MAAVKPGHLRFWIPIIEILKSLGGSGQASEVADQVVERMKIPDEELNETLQSGGSKIYNQISWARFLLVRLGYLDASQRGVWTLTENGYNANLNEDNFHKELKELKKQRRLERKLEKQAKDSDEDQIKDEDNGDDLDYREELLNLLKSLPADGFERICQRLLRESGFKQVNVTGRSGDGGIDGNGILQVNPFVSFTVLFQCKRYKNTVSPSTVRDFRGAMMGRADKGIIMTTGTFSLEAKREAQREGVPPIELVDGEKLVDMFELLELGLSPRKTYDVNRKFFYEFGLEKA
jgi:restriction system protein